MKFNLDKPSIIMSHIVIGHTELAVKVADTEAWKELGDCFMSFKYGSA